MRARYTAREHDGSIKSIRKGYPWIERRKQESVLVKGGERDIPYPLNTHIINISLGGVDHKEASNE